MENDTVRQPLACTDRCPVERTISVLGGRWKPLILFHILEKPQRFNALCRLIPRATRRMLTQHLRELESDGIIDRKIFDKVPPHVEYSLSEKGRTLIPILLAMADWGSAGDNSPQSSG